MEARDRRPPIFELMQQEHFTPEEVADLFEIGLDVVRHAAFAGELPAQIINHDIISIRRDDAVRWLAGRGAAGDLGIAADED